MPIVVPPRADLGAQVQARGPGGNLPPGPPPPQPKLFYRSPHADPTMRWGGSGPLEGWVLQNPPGEFADGGAQWSLVSDVWGNKWLLLTTLSDGSPAYDWDSHPWWEPDQFFGGKRTDQEFMAYCAMNSSRWFPWNWPQGGMVRLSKAGLDLWKVKKGEQKFSPDGLYDRGTSHFNNDVSYAWGVVLDLGEDAPIRYWNAEVNLWTRQARLVRWPGTYSLDEKDAGWEHLIVAQFTALVQFVIGFAQGNYSAAAKQLVASISEWYDFGKGISDFDAAKQAAEDTLNDNKQSGKDIGNSLPGRKAPPLNRATSAKQLAPGTAGTLITQRADYGADAGGGLDTETIIIAAAVAALLLLD